MTEDHYRDGFDAHARDAEATDNPHPPGSTAYALWRRGWNDREDHQNRKAECLPGW